MTITELMLQLGLAENKGVNLEQIEAYQQKLYHANRALIPLGYMRFLQQVNGVQTDTLSLFGIRSDDNAITRDIFENNTVAGTQDHAERIFLGDNFTEYLSYDWREKCYLIIEKQTLKTAKMFALFDQAMVYFLRDYIKIS